MDNFNTWWNSEESPRRFMPETTQYLIKDFMRQAYNAGLANRGERIERKQSRREMFVL